MKEITIPLFENAPEWERAQAHMLEHHLWAKAYPCYYKSYAKLCAVCGKGFFARLYSEEPQPKAVYTKRDEPVYKDSCMELFLQPVQGDARYINIEMNPNGAYLGEIGTGRFDRILLSELSKACCEVTPLKTESGWGVELFLPFALVSDCYGTEYEADSAAQLRANVYKCGDGTQQPHYSSLFSVDTPKPDYHRPEFFGTVKLYDERNM